jgi:TspO/MBR family
MTTTVTTPEATSRDTVRQIAVLLSTFIATVVSFLGSGAVVGTPVSQVANGALDTDATLVAPAGPAFAIWGVIYTGLLLLGINQVMPWRRADARQRRAGWLIVASALLNAAWIVTVQLELLIVSVVLIGALVGVLVAALVRLNERPATTAYERLVVDGTLGLYLGWACIATVANTAAAALDAGASPTVSTATTWAIVVLIIAAGVGVLLAVGLRGRIAPAIGLAWGLAWVAAERAGGLPQSDAVAVAAGLAAAITLIAAIVVRSTKGSPTATA